VGSRRLRASLPARCSWPSTGEQRRQDTKPGGVNPRSKQSPFETIDRTHHRTACGFGCIKQSGDQVPALFSRGHQFVVSWSGYAPAIICRDARSSPRSLLGMAQRIGCVRLHAHGWPDGGRAGHPGWRAVACLAAARQWLPGSGHRTPAVGRGDGPARCRDPAQARSQAARVDAAQIASGRATCWSTLAVRNTRLNRKTEPKAQLAVRPRRATYQRRG
jgi:hypothetical protein